MDHLRVFSGRKFDRKGFNKKDATIGKIKINPKIAA
jgi:hypothetical protein